MNADLHDLVEYVRTARDTGTWCELPQVAHPEPYCAADPYVVHLLDPDDGARYLAAEIDRGTRLAFVIPDSHREIADSLRA